MEFMPEFRTARPTTVAEAVAIRAAEPGSRFLAGGTDLIPNIRRGIVAPPTVIDLAGIAEMRAIESLDGGLRIGAAVTLAELANHERVRTAYVGLKQAAGGIAASTHRQVGTVGGNLCLDTRCVFYNQSEWWRGANQHCLKTTGEICHVAPKSKGVCFATFSGDLAPAFLVLDGEVDIAGPEGRRTLPLDDLYIGYARQDGSTGDGRNYLGLQPDEIVTAVRARRAPGLRSAYDKIRIRRSIEYPVAGVAVALGRDSDRLTDLRIAFTGTNPRPVLLTGTAELCGGGLDESTLTALDDLVRDQVMAMKTTFTPGHYRRRVANALARRLVHKLFEE
ncbi:MAG: 4-hydroxybenzoyl-CoA reductase subunit beta [Alphaproteobacteria bacterium]|nr:4-hydroxybenzoyl-CoA reductase subunit beta [Alphaproteobacteria bacterium]